MKWVIIGVLFSLCVAIGYIFSIKYRRREQFYSALIMFAQKLDVEINFSRQRLKKLIEDIDEKTKRNLFGLDKNFLHYLESNSELTQDELFKNCPILKPDEKQMVFLFFKSLGRSDVSGQSKEIQNFVKRFDENLSKCASENKKYGSLSLKLGFIAGLFMVVILL